MQPELSGADRGDIAAGAGTQDDDIIHQVPALLEHRLDLLLHLRALLRLRQPHLPRRRPLQHRHGIPRGRLFSLLHAPSRTATKKRKRSPVFRRPYRFLPWLFEWWARRDSNPHGVAPGRF